VVYTGTTQTGRARITVALAQVRGTLLPGSLQQVRALDVKEGRQLAERVKYLIADRDDMVTRLAMLERGTEELKASVVRTEQIALDAKRASEATMAAATPPPAPAAAAPADDVTSSIGAPEPAPPAAVAPDKPEFGIDLGSAPNFEGLRRLWANARQHHAAALDGLRPIVHLRERPRPNPHELRLVAGPVPTSAAARLCASIAATGGVCQPTPFDGQRLVVR
jgi:hypothetical protein